MLLRNRQEAPPFHRERKCGCQTYKRNDGARTNVRGLTRNLESHVQIRLPPVRTVWATWRTHEEAKEMRKGAGE